MSEILPEPAGATRRRRAGGVALALVALFVGASALFALVAATTPSTGAGSAAKTALAGPNGAFVPPVWNSGNLCNVQKVGSNWTCKSSGSGQCSPPLTYNFSANWHNISIHSTGSSNCVYLNFRGNHDTINIRVDGSKFPAFVVQVSGQHDIINLEYHGSRINSTYVVFLDSNTYNLDVTGSDNTFHTYFVGAALLKGLCPWGNMASQNDVNLYASGSNNYQNVTYVNAIGKNTTFNLTGMDGHGMNNLAGWQNVSEPWACPWTAPPPMALPGAIAPFGSPPMVGVRP